MFSSLTISRVGSPLPGWVRHPYRVGLPPQDEIPIPQLLFNLQISMTYQNVLELNGKHISWIIWMIWASLMWPKWLPICSVFPLSVIKLGRHCAHNLIWRPMGHPTSHISSVPELYLLFLTTMVVYFPYVDYIGTDFPGTKNWWLYYRSGLAAHGQLRDFKLEPK